MMTLLGEVQILLERTYGPTGVNFEDFLLSAARLPHVAATYARHGDDICTVEIAHLRTLMTGSFDFAYHESCRRAKRLVARTVSARASCSVQSPASAASTC